MFKGEGHRADDNEYENVREEMNNPLGSDGFVPIGEVPTEDSDPLEQLIKEEEENIKFSSDEENNDAGEVGGETNDSQHTSGDSLKGRYIEHGVATGEEADVASIATSGEYAPNTPRLKNWWGLRKENKRDEIRGKESRK